MRYVCVCVCVCASAASPSVTIMLPLSHHITSLLSKPRTDREPGQVVGDYIQPARSMPYLEIRAGQYGLRKNPLYF